MVASDTSAKRPAAVASLRRPKRVYLVPPACWKSARLAAQSAAVDWSLVVSAPASWSERWTRPTPTSKVSLHGLSSAALRLSATAHMARLHAALFSALRGVDVAKTVAALGNRVARWPWPAWDQINRRRALTAFSLCVAFGAIAIPLVSGVAHSQPELESHAMLSAPVTSQTLAKSVAKPVIAPPMSTEKTDDIESIVVLPKAAPAMRSDPPSSIASLSDVSTMDLMMPIAEPDLNIASHQSLWAQVGKEFGVDPLLLYSIALVESRSLHPGGDIGPTPWLFRVNDRLVVGERHHVQMEMAVASQLNATVQDVGIMQVYYPMHRDAVRDPLSLLDPRTNISVAAKILHDGMRETRDPVLGVGYYHSHTQQLARDYGTAVMTVYQRLKIVYRSGKNAQIVAR